MTPELLRIKPDCWTEKAQYLLGEPITLTLLPPGKERKLPVFKLFSLARELTCEPVWEQMEEADGSIYFKASISGLGEGYYGVEAHWEEDFVSTAFDVATDRRKDIRYGFLSDFSSEDTEDEDIKFAAKLHLNTCQFYDWMYRHDKLIAEEDKYTDPLGRETSLKVIRQKISACKEHGIRPFAYGAVYAATDALFNRHPEWAVYTLDGQPMRFADWLYYMDTSKESPWSDYIVEQYSDAVKQLGFQGIHMDTYGFPKHVWNSKKEPVSLGKTFPVLIQHASQAVKEADAESGVIFNAVNNWPVEEVAAAPQDAVYIEVWPPHDTYHDLYSLIHKAKQLAQKPVVLAAYMKPFLKAETIEEQKAAETALLLTYAVINASGGRHLVFGENQGVLCDSYYAKYAVMREEFLPEIRAYCDFAVRYGALFVTENTLDISMTATDGINEDIVFSAADGVYFSSDGEAGSVWTIIREADNRLVIQLINLAGISNRWNEPKPLRPALISNLRICILLDRKVNGVYGAAPEADGGRAISLDYHMEIRKNGRYWIIDIPYLNLWKSIWLELD